LSKKVEKCLIKQEFDLHILKYNKFSENLESRTSTIESDIYEKQKEINTSKDNLVHLQSEIQIIKEKQHDVITSDDLTEIRERIDTKADKVEIAQIYDIKSNKVDITSLVKSLD